MMLRSTRYAPHDDCVVCASAYLTGTLLIPYGSFLTLRYDAVSHVEKLGSAA